MTYSFKKSEIKRTYDCTVFDSDSNTTRNYVIYADNADEALKTCASIHSSTVGKNWDSIEIKES